MPNNTLLTDAAYTNLVIDGEAPMLARYQDGTEEFHRYTANELLEVFTVEELDTMARGGVAIQQLPRTGELVKWTSMLGAARFRIEANA